MNNIFGGIEDNLELGTSYKLLISMSEKLNNLQKQALFAFVFIISRLKVNTKAAYEYYDLEFLFDIIISTIVENSDFFGEFTKEELEEDDLLEKLIEVGFFEFMFVNNTQVKEDVPLDFYMYTYSDVVKNISNDAEIQLKEIKKSSMTFEDDAVIFEIELENGKEIRLKNRVNELVVYYMYYSKGELEEARIILSKLFTTFTEEEREELKRILEEFFNDWETEKEDLGLVEDES